jgi:hypothetical protein
MANGTISVVVRWRVTWTSTDGGGPGLPPINQTATLGGIPVAEIQSING